MTLFELQSRVREMALAKGWHNAKDLTPDWIAARLALVHGEVSEAVECVRKSKMDELPEELADVVIRVLCVASALGIDLEAAVAKKMEKNRGRTWSLESGLT